MERSIVQIAEAFSRHDFEQTYDAFWDTIRWINVGGETIDGKAAVIATCRQSAAFLADMTTTFASFRTIVGQDCVVIDSEATYTATDEGASRVASCDLYDFADGKLIRITSYTIELH